MADLFCNLLDFRSPSTNYYFKLHFLSPSRNFSSSIAPSFSTSVCKIRRSPLFCKPASPALDVISTHEHHDGSVLFRFGDPSEIVENVDLEKSTSVLVEGIEREGVEESTVVEVLDSGYENEVVIDKAGREANGYGLTEVKDELESLEESSVVEVLDGDYGGKDEIEKAEKEVNDYGSTEVTDELESVEESSVVEVLGGDYGGEDAFEKEETEADDYGMIEVTNELESAEESSVVKDLDGDYESNVVTDQTEIEANSYVLNELTDELDPDVSGTETISSVESDDESSDSEGESSDSEDELPVPTSSVEMEVLYNTGPDIESVTSDQEFPEDSSLSNVSVTDQVSEIENTMETVVAADESVSPELQYVDAELTNEIIEYGKDNGTSQSSLETVVIKDESVSSELQSVDVELNDETIEDSKEINLTDLPMNLSEEAQSSTDDTVDTGFQNVEPEAEIEIVIDGMESDSSELLSDSPKMHVDVSLSEEAECENLELPILSVVVVLESPELQEATNLSAGVDPRTSQKGMGILCEIVQVGLERDVIELTSLSPMLEVESKLDGEMGEETVEELIVDEFTGDDGSEGDTEDFVEMSPELEETLASGVDLQPPELEETLASGDNPQTSQNGMGILNGIVPDEIEIDLTESTILSPMLDLESKLDEGMGEKTVEEFTEDEFTGDDGSEGGTNDFVEMSPVLEEALASEVDPQTSENGMGIMNKVVQDEVESDVMKSTSVSPTLETESKCHEEIGEETVEDFEEDVVIGDDGSENDTILLVTESPQEEAEPINYVVTSNGALEEFQDDDRVEIPSALNNVPEDLIPETEGTADDDDIVQLSQLPETLREEMTGLGSTESATNRKEVMTDFVLSSGAAQLPHPSKVLAGGEDAYFVAGQTWLGVADGVVQWSLEGTKPGVYAQELIRNCERLASDCTSNSISYPVDLLKSSVAEMPSAGYSTVLITQFDGQALHVANVGDSGFIILRHGTVYKRSSPMIHAFHFPLLFEKDDDPSHVSEVYKVDLEEDDVIITATDGLFDNLYDQEISSIVIKSLAAETKLEDIAVLLAKKAQDVGRSTSSRSPFADSAQAAGYAGYTGGKLDDVTVIVSVVKRQSSSQTV